ncbi:hypothetical protein K474DRAFT_1604078 [Panus rudis PR-1116 ss-1]|nr:hypothetical protein K474DRAFT_1604078 [Panus rudis PR-1116 ss-1]
MERSKIPSELFTHIVQHVRQPDLVALALTSKKLNQITERELYSEVILRDVPAAFRFCNSVLIKERYSFVRRFWFYQDHRRGHCLDKIPVPFWQLMQAALAAMSKVTDLLIFDPEAINSWILNPTRVKVQLCVAALHFTWDASLVAFLETQHRLQFLQTMEPFDNIHTPRVSPNALPNLQVFDGPLVVAAQLLSCPLTHIRLTVHEDRVQDLFGFLSFISHSKMPVRSLEILVVYHDIVDEIMELLSSAPRFCAQIRHLGILAMDPLDHTLVLECLMKMNHLRSVEIDMSGWMAHPTPLFGQKVIVSELLTYCPSLRRVCIWVNRSRILWTYDGEEWVAAVATNRSVRDDSLWRSV